jgi:hypothetical protein
VQNRNVPHRKGQSTLLADIVGRILLFVFRIVRT